MKRTYLCDFEIFGPVTSWPAECQISHNQRNKTWTLYIEYTDPEASDHISETCTTPGDVLDTIESRGLDWQLFCDSSESSGESNLEKLASDISELTTSIYGTR